MMRYQRTRSSMFLMEIIINLLLFSILCVCSLQFFIRSYNLTEKTTTLHHAVTACSNISSIFESGNGELDIIYNAYPYAIYVDDKILIYYDDSYTECDREHGAYYVLIEKKEALINKVSIRYYEIDSDYCYSIEAYNYQPLTPSTMEEVTVYD